jgi:hypothetical protein
MEYLFLEHCFRWLVEGGVLLMVVPQERLDAAIPLLAGNFTGLRVYRLTDPEAERFDQVATFGVRRRMRGERHDRNRTTLLEMVWRREMPSSTRTCVASPSVCVALPRSSHASGLSCCLAAVRVFRLPE